MPPLDQLHEERLRFICENSHDIQSALCRMGMDEIFNGLATEDTVAETVLTIGAVLRLDQNIRWSEDSTRGTMADAHRGPEFKVEIRFVCPNEGRRHCSRAEIWDPDEQEQLPHCELSGAEFRWDGHERLVS